MFDRVYRHQLDAKNRMRIPAKFREELGSDYTVTLGSGGCLFVFTASEMSKLKKSFEKISPFDTQKQKSVRKFLAYAWDAEEDNQGRILIPQDLRTAAKIDKEIVILKNMHCYEIWAADVWQKYIDDVDFETAAQDLMQVTENE